MIWVVIYLSNKKCNVLEYILKPKKIMTDFEEAIQNVYRGSPVRLNDADFICHRGLGKYKKWELYQYTEKSITLANNDCDLSLAFYFYNRRM